MKNKLLKLYHLSSRLIDTFVIVCLLVAFTGLIMIGVTVVRIALWPDHLFSCASLALAVLLISAGITGWKITKPKRVPCALCDRGDGQLGHADNCALKTEN